MRPASRSGGGSAPSGGSRGDGDGERVPPGRAEAPRTTEQDPLLGPDSSPWVRYERLRDEMSGEPAHPRAPLPDLSALLAAIEGLRGLIPRELSEQFTALVREVLLTLRALIDWYLERLEGGPSEPEVEEIPID